MVVGYLVGLTILTFHCLPSPAWADGNLAESAGLLGNMVGHPNQRQPNPVTNHHPHPVVILTDGFLVYNEGLFGDSKNWYIKPLSYYLIGTVMCFHAQKLQLAISNLPVHRSRYSRCCSAGHEIRKCGRLQNPSARSAPCCRT